MSKASKNRECPAVNRTGMIDDSDNRAGGLVFIAEAIDELHLSLEVEDEPFQ